jgi:hypothetical protein
VPVSRSPVKNTGRHFSNLNRLSETTRSTG